MAAYRDVCSWVLDAAFYNRCEELKRHLTRYGNDMANFRHRRGITALHKAAENFSVDAVKILLAAGANPNALADDGLSPLLATLRRPTATSDSDSAKRNNAALESKRLTIAKLLTDAGALPKIHVWYARSVTERLNSRVDGSRFALVGQLRLDLALGFRLQALRSYEADSDDDIASPSVYRKGVFNHDIISVIASYLLPQDGLCSHVWDELTSTSNPVWYCTAEALEKAKRKAVRYRGYTDKLRVPQNSTTPSYISNSLLSKGWTNLANVTKSNAFQHRRRCHRRQHTLKPLTGVERAVLETTALWKSSFSSPSQKEESDASPRTINEAAHNMQDGDVFLPFGPDTMKALGL